MNYVVKDYIYSKNLVTYNVHFVAKLCVQVVRQFFGHIIMARPKAQVVGSDRWFYRILNVVLGDSFRL